MKQRIGIIFGGRSGEHEVSIRSAESIRNALDLSKYDVVMIGIDKQGAWRLADPGRPLLDAMNAGDASSALIAMAESGRAVLREPDTGVSRDSVDVLFPIAHGTYGEDGSLQGLLRLLDVPFVGASVLGSAVAMDKDVMKRLLRDAGIPVPRFVTIREADRDQVSFDVLSTEIGTPLFVKPCNLGSSVGISRVDSPGQWDDALADAFRYDHKVIIEEAIAGRELECSVLGNDQPEASVPGEIDVHAEFYSYAAKYIDENGATLIIPAPLDDDATRRVQELSVAAFQALECSGMARVDLFLTDSGELYLNEINTLPGFTTISMYPKLWEASGVSYAELLDRLIALAIERHAQDAGLERSYDRPT